MRVGINHLMPHMKKLCNELGVAVYLNQSKIIFEYEGVVHQTDCWFFEHLANLDYYHLIGWNVSNICKALKESYFGMDN